MASWAALNVEPDDSIEEEVDDTKELQIEEALKLYQTALKLHSQGPEFYSQAADAYDVLLKSEIFKYPESISDFKRAAESDVQTATVVEEDPVEAIGEFNVNDSTSSLFQTLYLTHKNYGKYLLDSVHETIRNAPDNPDTVRDTFQASKKALASFADALERDDTDLNLWRQSARLSSALDSYRLNRFCLESVLADDDNRLEIRPEQLGIEEMFSEERLRSTLTSLFDGLSASQVPVKKPKKALVKYLKQHEDPYPYLPDLPAELGALTTSKGPLALSTSVREIKPKVATWEAMGEAILQALDDEEEAPVGEAPTRSLQITLPPRVTEELDNASVKMEDLENETVNKAEDTKPEKEDIDMVEENDATKEPERPPTAPQESSEAMEDQSSIDQSAEKQLMESLEGHSVPPAERQHEEEENQQGENRDEEEPKSPISVRKRSSASAANEEPPEGGRMKSRRTRARESNADALVQPEEIAFDQEKYYEDRLEIFVNADEWMFNTVGSLFSKAGISALGTIASLKEKVATVMESDKVSQEPEARLFQDLRGIIKNWNDEKSRLMQQKEDPSLKDISGSKKSGLAVFLEHSRKSNRRAPIQEQLPSGEELYGFSDRVNSGRMHPHDISFTWLKCLLMPQFGHHPSEFMATKSSYACFIWPQQLKEVVVDILLREDESVFSRLCEAVAHTEHRVLDSNTDASFEYTTEDFAIVEMIQSIYELHLDIFASVEKLRNEISQEKRLSQRDRLTRWAMLARTSLEFCIDYCPSETCRQNIAFRHLWTSTFHLNLAGEAERDHVLLCLQDLKQMLQALGDPIINLVNNSIMAELSIATIDQEALKLKCMDFFAMVFNSDGEDPVSLIESIEPILEPSSVEHPETSSDDANPAVPSHSSEMASFLDRGDATLRLFLWKKLQEAYQAIDYPPKVVSCYLRSIETVMIELEDAKHLQETNGPREVILLGCLKTLDSILVKTIPLVLPNPEKAYECVDMDHLESSMSAVARLTRLLHSFILYEDSVRVGQISGRDFRGSLAKTLENFKERMRETYVRCWLLLYTLFLEAISQNKDVFNEPIEDRIQILRSVHNALGVRSMCRYSQKRFLKLMKSELLNPEIKGDYDLDICQVLFDLHGVKFSPFDGTADHGCSPEKLDRPTAIMMIDFVMRQAQKMNMKDLSKSELKTTIEKMQHLIGPAKPPSSQSCPPVTFNRRLISAYIKAPINPSHLLRAVQGVTELPLQIVPGENAKIAAKGWYFLLGHATLTKFRAQKRLSPGSTSELDDAVNFFRQDLDNGAGRWETWYRLAQVYDTKFEEEITWAADKINNSRSDLAATQRYAIHCYSMAVSMAIRTAEATPETRSLMSNLYTDFGIRLYSSSREPMAMSAFGLTEFSRHFSSEESQQMYKAQPFKEMSRYSVWNFASNLLRRAIIDKPKHWMTHYFLGKCLWKMFNCDDSLRTTSRRVEMRDVLDAFRDAIAALPQRRDSRSDPIFEPHFKLLSIVHRLVVRGKMTPIEGSKTLAVSPWARKVDAPESMEAWKPYILEVIKKFKSADKSNWHHRMSAKAAHILYDDDKNATTAAAAKHEMSQIFTKTLTIQVWRPEFERPGRHFVYTTRYVYFFVNLLDELDDRVSLDQLLRRVRKKQGDFINHPKLWEDICLAYAKVIRRAAQINESHEEVVFKPIGWDEFSSKTARLETLTPMVPESNALLELIRDALELKKLNNNLMKVTMFEDLIADLYARLYEVNMPLLIEQVNEENKEKMKVDHLLMTGDANTEPSTPAASLPASDTPAPRGRTKGIARRDIQKRADTIVNLKLAPRALVAKFTSSADHEQATPGRRASNGAAASGPNSTPHASGKQGSVDQDGNLDNQDSNAVRDSGDEGDISDADESKLDKSSSGHKSKLFSHLRKDENADNETEDDAGSHDGEDDEGDGDEDEAGHDNDGEGDGEAGATEAETAGEDADDAGDEDLQEDEGDDTTIEESKLEDLEDQNDEKVEEEDASKAAAAKTSAAATPGDDADKTDDMDTTLG